MKKKLVSMFMTVSMVSALLAGCGSTAATTASSSAGTGAAVSSVAAAQEDAAAAGSNAVATAAASTGSVKGKTFGIIIRAAGNPYAEKEAQGFKEVIEAAGATCIVKEPETATADAQIPMIQSLISQKVNSIAIASNDVNALTASLQEAMKAGIKVSTLDSNVVPQARQVFVNQAGTNEIGQALMDAVLDISGGSGDWAILSASSQSANQNAWIDAMKKIMKDSKYSKLNLLEVAYGDDEPQKSTDQTQALLSKYPNLKVICSPTTVGISAAAKVLQDQKSKVKLTGLGLPSEMSEYIGTDAEHSCPYMFLWNPEDVGKLSAYTSIALVSGTITGKKGETFKAGDMTSSPYTIGACSDGGTEVILGPPYKFDPSNITKWKEVY